MSLVDYVASNGMIVNYWFV